MTIEGLISRLQKAAKEIGPRARVTVDFKDIALGMPEHLTYWEINVMQITTVPWEKEGSFELSDGSERQRTIVVLS